MLQAQSCLDNSSDARAAIQMPDIGLGRTDRTVLILSIPISPGLVDRRDLDRIAETSACAMRLDIAEVFRRNTCYFHRVPDRFCLPWHTGGREAGFRTTVVVYRSALDHSTNIVAIIDRIAEWLDRDHDHAAATNHAAGLLVKRIHVTIGRQYIAIDIVIANLVW